MRTQDDTTDIGEAQDFRAKPQRIAASIEMTPKQALQFERLPGLFPDGTRVYVADLVGTDGRTQVDAASRLRSLGYEPVPHLAARRLVSRAALNDRIAALVGEAGIAELLIIGGGLAKPAGVFPSSLAVLETGLIERYGIRQIGLAGHPEGTPDFDDVAAFEALRRKQAYGEQTGANVRIVTQFGFNSEATIRWASSLPHRDIRLPVHVGIAGPARLTTLLKYAASCGVGNSVDFLKRRASSLTALTTSQSPEIFARPIEEHWSRNPDGPITQIHVFPFGGVQQAAEWLKGRGSWPISDSAT